MANKIKEVYLDYAATTYLDPRVKEAMEPYWNEDYGNPSSLYRLGRRAKDALDKARKTVAQIFNAKPAEIIFTGGGTEAINLAIFGMAHFYSNVLKNIRMSPGHLITSKIEHHAVLHSMEALLKEGFEVTYLDVDGNGLVDPSDVEKAIRPNTILVSIMYANNEIGTIEPIEKISEAIKQARILRMSEGNAAPLLFHTDACQAAGALDLDVQKLGVDLMVINGSKIYGPKGVGALYKRLPVRLQPLIYGGGQEQNFRSGTENIPGIVGLTKALEISQTEREKENSRLTDLRNYFIHRILREIPKIVLNGHPATRLPNNINISILDIEGEAALLYLDEYGISASTGSACTSTTLDPSHVILALGRPYEYAHGSLRFTLGRKTTKGDIDYVMSVLPWVIEKLRAISPVKLELGQNEISHPEVFAGQGAKLKARGRSYK